MVHIECEPRPAEEVEAIVGSEAQITISGIERAVTEYYITDARTLVEKGPRDSELEDALAIFCTLAVDEAKLTYDEVARRVDRGSGGVWTAVKRIRSRAVDEPVMQQHLQELAAASRGEPLPTTLSTWPELVSQHSAQSLEEIRTGRNVRAVMSRQILAHLLDKNTTLTRTAIGRRTGNGRSKEVKMALTAVEERRQASPYFARQLAELEGGRLPKTYTIDDILSWVTQYYRISRDELTGSGRDKKEVEARAMAVHLLTREFGFLQIEVQEVFGHEIRQDRLVAFDDRLEQSVELQRKKQEILNPKECRPRPKQIMTNACRLYGIDEDTLSIQSQAGRYPRKVSRTRNVIVYLWLEKLSLPMWEVAELMPHNVKTIHGGLSNIKAELSDNQLLAAEVAFLETVDSVSCSLHERIIQLVAEDTGLDVADIMEPQSPYAIQARWMAIALIAQRGYYSLPEIAEFFSLYKATVNKIVQKIDHDKQVSSELAQNLTALQESVLATTPWDEGPQDNQQVAALLASRPRQALRKGSAPDSANLYMAEIGQTPLLNGLEEEKCLAKAIEKGRRAQTLIDAGTYSPELTRAVKLGAQARDELIRAGLRLVVNVVKPYPLPTGWELRDLIQEGNLGLEHAADKYDWRKGYRFSTYAVFWIKAYAERALRQKAPSIKLPEKKAAALRQALLEAGGDEARLSPEYREWHRLTSPTSLQAPLGKEESAELIDTIADREAADPEAAAVTSGEESKPSQNHLALLEALDQLPEKHATLLRLCHGIDGPMYTLGEIAQIQGRSPRTLERALKNAEEALRKKLEPLYP